MDIKDDVAIVGGEVLPPDWCASHFYQLPCDVAARHRYHLDRQRKGAKYIDQLATICNADKCLACTGNNFFTGQCATTTLDQVQVLG